jgi:hypothetical protein
MQFRLIFWLTMRASPVERMEAVGAAAAPIQKPILTPLFRLRNSRRAGNRKAIRAR